MTAEKFCLKWNDFESNISVAFRDIRDQSEFFDVTLACEDNQIDAHKVILSACSPFFRGVLKRNPHQHPLLYLKGIKFADLESVLNFMYHGEVNVAQDQLNSFLQVAEDLRVKGLTQNKNGEKSHERVSPSPAIKSRAPDRDQGGPAPKRPRPSLPPPPTEQDDDDDIQEVVPVKSEPRDVVPAVPPPPPAPEPDFQQALVQQDDYSIEEEYEDYDQYQDDTYQGHNQEPDKGHLVIYGDIDQSIEEENLSTDVLKLVEGSRHNSVQLLVNDQYRYTLNTAKRFPLVQWKCTRYGSKVTNCPCVFMAYVSNHAELRELNPYAETPLELAKDMRAIYRLILKPENKLDHNHL